ncbi:MAG: substrate-binding domain-containing protein, partial [Anaerolineae bacterium]|nr:substrate-binding domain-containing protein [Anaerolineae bacterium]
MQFKRLAVTAISTAMLVSASGIQARNLIQNKGSDTLVNVAQAWAEAYQSVNPDVAVAVSGGGSGTGIAAMINGTVDIANASRKMKDKEVKMADEQGHHPVEHTVGFDALAVYLHQDNPATQLTIEQLKQIYIRDGKATKWSDLGLKVPGCSSDEIVVVSR